MNNTSNQIFDKVVSNEPYLIGYHTSSNDVVKFVKNYLNNENVKGVLEVYPKCDHDGSDRPKVSFYLILDARVAASTGGNQTNTADVPEALASKMGSSHKRLNNAVKSALLPLTRSRDNNIRIARTDKSDMYIELDIFAILRLMYSVTREYSISIINVRRFEKSRGFMMDTVKTATDFNEGNGNANDSKYGRVVASLGNNNYNNR